MIVPETLLRGGMVIKAFGPYAEDIFRDIIQQDTLSPETRRAHITEPRDLVRVGHYLAGIIKVQSYFPYGVKQVGLHARFVHPGTEESDPRMRERTEVIDISKQPGHEFIKASNYPCSYQSQEIDYSMQRLHMVEELGDGIHLDEARNAVEALVRRARTSLGIS